MIDSHTHLYHEWFDADRDEVIARARSAGVQALINIGTDLETSRKAVDLALRHADFRATAGIHPATLIPDLDAEIEGIRGLIARSPEQVVAVGEIGLDYHWGKVDPEDQKVRLRRQLAMALECALPVVFHCRDALSDLFAVLEDSPELPPGVFHCFEGGEADARRAVNLGFHVSFAGNVTFPKATLLKEAALWVPPERLLLETDAPFLAPQPCRGRRNEPAYVVHTCGFIAQLKGMSPADLDAATTATARALFRLPPL
jgi:TatD DNase family protein